MILFLIQTAVLVAAGIALWRLWRVTDRYSSRIGLLVAGALVLRAIPGVLLFWISFLELPFARSLQLDKGFWFFATDGLAYFNRALVAINDGPRGIVLMTDHNPSLIYNQVLALFAWALGPIPAIGVLLNAFAFLGIAALVATWARRHEIGVLGAAIPIAAAGYSPSWVLWSTQPLKDAFFCFVVVLFAFAIDLWVRVWREEAPRLRRIIGAGVLLAVSIYAVAGVRWYYALVALAAAMLPFASVIFRAGLTPRRRAFAALATALLLFVLAQQIVFASGPYLPDSMRHVLRLRPKLAAELINDTIEGSRRSFDAYVDSGTRIRVGEKLAKAEQPKPVAVAAKTPEPVAPAPAPPAVAVTTTIATSTTAPVPAPTPAPVAAAKVEAPKTTVADPVSDERPAAAQSDVPTTWKTRLIAGVTALLLPHFVGEGLGLISLGGGRGFWWFADFDTILFNIFLFASLAALFVRRKAAWRDPFVWYLLGVSIAIAGALAYTVSNYGALFRHRSMVLAVIVLLPLAAYRARKEVVVVEDPEADEEPRRDTAAGVSLASSAEG